MSLTTLIQKGLYATLDSPVIEILAEQKSVPAKQSLFSENILPLPPLRSSKPIKKVMAMRRDQCRLSCPRR
jgi:hypothetical protein